MPQQTVRVDDNGNPIAGNAPPVIGVGPGVPQVKPKPLSPEDETEMAQRAIIGGVKAIPQIALAFLTRGMSIPAQAGYAGGAGVIRAKLEGSEDPLMEGALDAGMTGVTGGLANMVKPVRLLQNAAGPEAKMTAQQAEEILAQRAGRLVPSNTQAMREAADKVRTSIPNLPRNAQGRIIPGPRSLPGPSPLDPAAAAHEAGVMTAARRGPASAHSSAGALLKFVGSPQARSALAQGVSSIAGNNPSGLANAVRIALMELLSGESK